MQLCLRGQGYLWQISRPAGQCRFFSTGRTDWSAQRHRPRGAARHANRAVSALTRLLRVQLVDGVYGFRCPLLGLQLRLSRPTGRQNALWARRILPSSQAGPNPLGENQSLSSPPLEPRGLLLSVMRQKVGKERSQGVFAPLANPHRFLACPLRKFGPSPTPLEAVQNPGWSAQRHRRGRAMQSIATGSAKLLRPKLGQDLPMAAAATPRGRPGPLGTRKFQRVVASGKSYERRRVARTARGGGGSRDPTGRRFSTCRPIPRHPPRKTTLPHGH